MSSESKKGFLGSFLKWVEVAGNKLPDPTSIFIITTLFFMALSVFLAHNGTSVVHPLTQKEVFVVNMLSAVELQKLLANAVKNFAYFPPLGLILVVIIGSGVADKSGLMKAAIKRGMAKASKKLVVPMIFAMAIVSHLAADVGVIVLPPLAAMIFLTLGRHPLVGLYCAFGAWAAAFSATFFVGMTDIIAASFTIPAAQLIKPDYNQTPAMNYYFLVASSVVLMIVATFVTEKIIEPRLGVYTGDKTVEESKDEQKEAKGLKWAGISLLIVVGIIVSLCIGDKPFLGDVETGSLLSSKSYLMQGMVIFVTIIFLVPSVVFGAITGSIKSDKDVARMAGEGMSEMGGYIVLIFFAAQFLTVFNNSNVGVVMSVKGAEFLKGIGFTGFPLFVFFILLCAFTTLFIGSSSAKWAIFAPIFVPMFLLLGYDPAFTQAAFRIGASISSPITPLFPYFPVLLIFARKYQKDIGVGNIISNMIPYSISFFIAWVLVFAIFMIFDLPLGPGGAGIYLNVDTVMPK